MAIVILIFMGVCLFWGLRAANKLFHLIKPKEKKFKPPTIHYTKAEERKPDPTPAVTNIQNNFTTNQVIIIEASNN